MAYSDLPPTTAIEAGYFAGQPTDLHVTRDPWRDGPSEPGWEPAWAAIQTATAELHRALATPTLGAFEMLRDGDTHPVAAIWWNTLEGRNAVSSGLVGAGEPLLLWASELDLWLTGKPLARPLPKTLRDVAMSRLLQGWRDAYTRPIAQKESADAPNSAKQSAGLKRGVRKVVTAGLRRWYQQRVQGWPEELSGPTELEDLTAAKLVFPKLSRRSLREVREQEAPSEWRKQGPRKSAKSIPPK